MATAGRKPKPTALKLIAGNPGRRKINGQEPKPRIGLPEPPDHLTDVAKTEWQRLGPLLLRLKLISELDVAAFGLYCQAYGRHVEAERAISQSPDGPIAYSHNGYPMMSPWAQVSKQAADQFKAMLTEFGLTPSSRARMMVEPPDDDAEDDEADQGKKFEF